MSLDRKRASITAVTLILGILVVAQLRSQGVNTGLASQSAQDLTLLVANLNTENEAIRGEVAALERQLATLSDTRSRGQSAAGQLRQDLDKIEAWAGLRAVDGPGVSIRVNGAIDGEGVEDLVNELRNAGAEAIAIDGVRLVPGSVVTGASGALFVEQTPLGISFEIRAIGSPQILTGSLTRTGGIIAQLSVSFPEATVSVTPLDALAIPVTERDIVPVHGQPSL